MITNESAKNTAFGMGFQRFTASQVEFGSNKGKRREGKRRVMKEIRVKKKYCKGNCQLERSSFNYG